LEAVEERRLARRMRPSHNPLRFSDPRTSPDLHLGLDAVGARVWELLELDPDLERACSRILAEYDVEDDRLRSDLLSLIGRLAMVGLYSPP